MWIKIGDIGDSESEIGITIEIGSEDWNWGFALRIGTGIGDKIWDLELGLEIGIGD